MRATPPIALTIAGSDSGGGAGIQADLKAFSALGTYGASVITAVTAQNTTAVTAVHEIPADVVAAQIKAVLSDLDVRAIKIGMLFSPAIIDAVARELESFDGHIVLDPVMIAKSGDALLQDAAITAMIDQMLPRATLLTPNLPEAARLLGATEGEEIEAQAHALLAKGPQAVLMKGGHGTGETCTDLLVTPDLPPLRLDAPRIDTRNTHGTGCTYSASIAAFLALGHTMPDAVTAAHAYLHEAIKRSDELQIGAGHGPVHHFHSLWDAHA
ncbi:hydroxymethylpyrimidine kinase /phosphomethylpyrimidine kinase [Litoreibacter ponti]|uniref:hydroxymethylpyrimidine kinase n=1 Tax=Litoreibacter ponti TaxID=1510457 RepID=A0A2T6BJ80_9RHOB|nr:bifunctional hydroxymethylpyrimidine kinase/phosphomethylpyrimidine kinase [Litoreibacter ponti]PTX56123.1 hydroxymethylpyrimidine kinase /phosphomethylpyrimidine kinase [Litoreibacter ponti]